MMAIKLNLRESERRSAYQNLVVDQTNAGVRVQNVGILQRASNALIFGLENVIVIWLAALLVMEGKFTVGMLYAFIGFKLLFLTRVINLIDKWNEFRMLDLHAERIADIALAEPEGSKPALPGDVARAAHHRGEGPGLRLRARRIRLQEREPDDRAGRDGRDRGAFRMREDHADEGAAGLAEAHRGRVRVNGRNLADWDRPSTAPASGR
jgi:ATP-binding cassette subfamily B protein RaxB